MNSSPSFTSPLVLPTPPCVKIICAPEPFQDPSQHNSYSIKIILLLVLEVLNVMVQSFMVIFILKKNCLKLTPFFAFTVVRSSMIIFRVSFLIFAIIMLEMTSESSLFLEDILQFSLLVDYCSRFFCLTIIFQMSLNQLFCFFSKTWNHRIFGNVQIVILILFSASFSITIGILGLRNFKIKRIFILWLGFFENPWNGHGDIYSDKSIHRMFHLFPVASIICYMILYYLKRQKNKKVLINTTNMSREEKSVHIEILITSILYLIIIIPYDILMKTKYFEQDSEEGDARFHFASTFQIFNHFPEISMPLLNLYFSGIFRNKIAPGPEHGKSSVETGAKI
ncbi:Serpentine Receptor, class Z [Caenorhabditis elegans]|uniref:Serpentine Receptor, class Z n=1 Tax=Caenorhabditis elegans TaxID=6239 RepID=Q9N5L8_CAEEL|nr:Serpentine Receptor, class Z [Caenorhabditis elegans]CCD61683.1 Serpentine Receptor, class Z [Caenorhabditis elegans]|eukprot:NP_494768.1 Uncharacterized protein CELE_H20J04.7 [Caenorhabditis elegans]